MGLCPIFCSSLLCWGAGRGAGKLCASSPGQEELGSCVLPRGGITQNEAGTGCLQAIVAWKCPYINPACSPASGSLTKKSCWGEPLILSHPHQCSAAGIWAALGGSGARQGSVLSITEAGNGSLAFPAIKRGAEVLQNLAGTSAH